MEDSSDVAQLVIRTGSDPKGDYFLAKRSEDSFWEFIGGKRKVDESIEEAAIRELKEEITIDWEDEMFDVIEIGEPYSSSADSSFTLYPVLIEVSQKLEKKVDSSKLSKEHSDFNWIKLNEFFSYDTLGQFDALLNLEIVQGNVAIAVTKNEDNRFLMIERSEEVSSSGKWVFPGGRIEDNESVADAAIRELKEEVGVSGKVVEKGMPYINKGELGFWKVTPVLVDFNKNNEISLNDECSGYEWLKHKEIIDKDTLGSLKAFDSLEKIKV